MRFRSYIKVNDLVKSLHKTLYNILTLYCLVVANRSHTIKQTCSFQLQVCISMCDLFVTTRHWRVKINEILDIEGRRIVAGSAYYTHGISIFIHKIMEPSLKEIP